MPRGRPRLIGPRLPKGGYKSLSAKYRLADKAAALASYASLPSINSQAYKTMIGISSTKKRGRSKLIGPRLPKGGYKSLSAKYRLAAKAAALASYASLPSINSQAYKDMIGISSKRGRGRPRKTTITITDSNISTAKQPRTKRVATEKQLAALVKARAARAIKRGAVIVGSDAFYDANE